jgi:hypothetical protein
VQAIVRVAPGELHAESFGAPGRLPDGRSLTLLARGRPAGSVEVGDGDGACAADASMRPGPARLDGSALATDLAVAAGPPLRVPPTAAERREMLTLLRKGTWPPVQRGTARDAVVRIDVVPTPRQGRVVVGSSWRWSHGAPWGAFIIAERDEDGTLQPNLTIGGSADYPHAQTLVDVVDLDGDGAPEIVTLDRAPTPQYEVIQRRDRWWEGLFDSSGCR